MNNDSLYYVIFIYHHLLALLPQQVSVISRNCIQRTAALKDAVDGRPKVVMRCKSSMAHVQRVDFLTTVVHPMATIDGVVHSGLLLGFTIYQWNYQYLLYIVLYTYTDYMLHNYEDLAISTSGIFNGRIYLHLNIYIQIYIYIYHI